jgi:hypothetical protein
MLYVKIILILGSWILGFIDRRNKRQFWLAFPLIIAIGLSFVDDANMRKLGNRLTSLFESVRPIEKIAQEHYPNIPKEQALKRYLNDLSRELIIDKQKLSDVEMKNSKNEQQISDLKKDNSLKELQIKDLTMKIKISEEMTYQEFALYNAQGFKKGFALNGITANPSPLDDWDKDFISRSEGKIICRCIPTAIQKCKSVIDKFPQYPFSYYFIACCLKEKGNQSWVWYANKAKDIFEKTTKLPNHHSDHDLIFAELKILRK